MEPEDCPAHAEWLPADGSQTPAVAQFEPAKHPNTECPFYSAGWQNFLIATHPDSNGDPLFASYATVDDVFTKATPLAAGALAPPGTHRGTQLRAWLGDIKQAGNRNILIDQDGRSLYYGIHINQTFVDFINNNGLTTSTAIQAAPKTLFSPRVSSSSRRRGRTSTRPTTSRATTRTTSRPRRGSRASCKTPRR